MGQREAEFPGGKNVKDRKKILFRLATRMLAVPGHDIRHFRGRHGFRSVVLSHSCNLKSSKELYK